MACYHCGEHVPEGTNFQLEIAGEIRPLCCPGCLAVAQLIAGNGMSSFYQQRTAYNSRPDNNAPLPTQHYQVYDDAQLLASYCDQISPQQWRIRLLLGGMTCAACTWLVERSLGQLAGVSDALVNLQQGRLDVSFNPDQLKASDIFARVEALGYKAQPFHHNAQREQISQEQKGSLRRLAVAGLGMMQVGMFSIALHAGDLQGISEQYQSLLRWVSMLVATFVVFYCAQSFFTTAIRHLLQGALVMDLPVALAIGLAWLASVWATVSQSGQVYFDSVVMFTFFLLLGRYLEQRIRLRHAMNWVDLEDSLPAAVQLYRDGNWKNTPRSQLKAGDIIRLRPGESICADAVIEQGHSAVREDSLNGEHLPRSVNPGDTVFAGTLNLEAALQAKVLGSYAQSRLAALQNSLHSAQQKKPALAKLADRIAAYFVAGILLITSLTAAIWYAISPDQALWVALSVLVISCPCALALATPAALTSAATALRANGVIVHGENALEALARCNTLLLDKTGTLTQGKLHIAQVQCLGETSEAQVLALAAGLQHFSNHPIASAFADISPAAINEANYQLGAGLEGSVNSTRYRMGSEPFCKALCAELPPPPDVPLYWLALVSSAGPLAWIGLGDPLRSDAAALINQVHKLGLHSELVTGDSTAAGPQLVLQLGIKHGGYGLSPQQKMQRLEQLQAEGNCVAMAGDGLNDAPVLAQADASFAVANATDLARSQADFIILGDELAAIAHTVHMARACRRIIWQNLGWALGYNACAIPLAAMGFIPPWLAAIGMSFSSLLVVLNSLRLNVGRQHLGG